MTGAPGPQPPVWLGSHAALQEAVEWYLDPERPADQPFLASDPLTCPIDLQVVRAPVSVTLRGRPFYERSALQRLLDDAPPHARPVLEPLTRQPFSAEDFAPALLPVLAMTAVRRLAARRWRQEAILRAHEGDRAGAIEARWVAAALRFFARRRRYPWSTPDSAAPPAPPRPVHLGLLLSLALPVGASAVSGGIGAASLLAAGAGTFGLLAWHLLANLSPMSVRPASAPGRGR